MSLSQSSDAKGDNSHFSKISKDSTVSVTARVLKKAVSRSRDDNTIDRSQYLKKRPGRRESKVSNSVLSSTKKTSKIVNNYKIIKKLGQGAFAKVRLVKDKRNGELFAMKQMCKLTLKQKRFGTNKTAYDAVMEELKVLQTLEHPNIIWLQEIIDDPNADLFLVTEYYSKGSIGEQMEKLNDQDANHNKQCLREGNISEIRTKGLKLW